MSSRSWVSASMTHRNTGFFPSLNAGAVRATADVMLVASDSLRYLTSTGETILRTEMIEKSRPRDKRRVILSRM